MEIYSRYGLEFSLRRYKSAGNEQLLKDFFNTGLKWKREGYSIYYYGISGEARAFVWNELSDKILETTKEAVSFTHFVGPVLSYHPKKGHIFVKLLMDPSCKHKTNLYLRNVRAYHHDLLLIATKDGKEQFEKGTLIFEKYHDIFSLGQDRYKAVINTEIQDSSNPYPYNVKKSLMKIILNNFENMPKTAKKINSPSNLDRIADKDIQEIARRAKDDYDGVDFDSITTEEFRILMKQYDIRSLPVVDT